MNKEDETRIYIATGIEDILEYLYIAILSVSIILLDILYLFPNTFYIYPLFKEFFGIFLIFSVVVSLTRFIFVPWTRNLLDIIFVISLIILYLFFNVLYSSIILFKAFTLIVSSLFLFRLLFEIGGLILSCSYPP